MPRFFSVQTRSEAPAPDAAETSYTTNGLKREHGLATGSSGRRRQLVGAAMPRRRKASRS
jgi:hypothetical protein